jgi:hypothetical protein
MVKHLMGLAPACATCIEGLDALRSSEVLTRVREAIRRRCADRGIAALSQAIDRGIKDARRLEEEDDLKVLRAPAGYRPLVERMKSHQSPLEVRPPVH